MMAMLTRDKNLIDLSGTFCRFGLRNDVFLILTETLHVVASIKKLFRADC